MKAIWNGITVAEAPKSDLIYIEGGYYFPPSSLKKKHFKKSQTPYHCFWKGDAQYFNLEGDGHSSKDAAWSYPQPMPGAIDVVKKDFANYVAFGPGVNISTKD